MRTLCLTGLLATSLQAQFKVEPFLEAGAGLHRTWALDLGLAHVGDPSYAGEMVYLGAYRPAPGAPVTLRAACGVFIIPMTATVYAYRGPDRWRGWGLRLSHPLLRSTRERPVALLLSGGSEWRQGRCYGQLELRLSFRLGATALW